MLRATTGWGQGLKRELKVNMRLQRTYVNTKIYFTRVLKWLHETHTASHVAPDDYYSRAASTASISAWCSSPVIRDTMHQCMRSAQCNSTSYNIAACSLATLSNLHFVHKLINGRPPSVSQMQITFCSQVEVRHHASSQQKLSFPGNELQLRGMSCISIVLLILESEQKFTDGGP